MTSLFGPIWWRIPCPPPRGLRSDRCLRTSAYIPPSRLLAHGLLFCQSFLQCSLSSHQLSLQSFAQSPWTTPQSPWVSWLNTQRWKSRWKEYLTLCKAWRHRWPLLWSCWRTLSSLPLWTGLAFIASALWGSQTRLCTFRQRLRSL